MNATLRTELERWAASLPGGWRLQEVLPLAPDSAADDDTCALGDETRKAIGYGRPLRLTLRDGGGRERHVVFHLAERDDFGHDRRADRAGEQLLAFDNFRQIPRHVAAIDVGALGSDGRILSLRETGELYLVTEWAPGRLYAEDLRQLAQRGSCTPLDLLRADALADYLILLHRNKLGAPAAYARALRDLVGSGEGIFGMVDGYPRSFAPRLQALERRALEWRWRLRDRAARACRTHGDFHPFNIVFGDGVDFRLLDASRGCVGDPADDLTALAVNYVFFAVEHPAAWRDGTGLLWHRFWSRYAAAAGDELFEVAAPFFAWRGLVVASPRFYPDLAPAARDRLLGLVERVLDAPRFDPRFADELFA
jgi:Phosphotransferase enzyme family